MFGCWNAIQKNSRISLILTYSLKNTLDMSGNIRLHIHLPLEPEGSTGSISSSHLCSRTFCLFSVWSKSLTVLFVPGACVQPSAHQKVFLLTWRKWKFGVWVSSVQKGHGLSWYLVRRQFEFNNGLFSICQDDKWPSEFSVKAKKKFGKRWRIFG